MVLQLPSMQALRPGLSSAPWRFHRFFPRVSSVCALLDARFLCSHASWPVLGSSSRFSWSWGFLHTGVVSSASWSCHRGPLGGILLLSPRGLPLGSVSWGVFQALHMFRGFSLLFFWLSCLSVSSLCQSGAVSEPFILLAAVVPSSLIPLRHLTFCRLVSVPVCPRDSCGLAGFVLHTLWWCSAVSLLFVGLLLVMVQPVLFLFSVSFCPFLGALLSELYSFSPSGLLSARPFILSPCPLGFSFLLVVCSCLLSPGWSASFSRVYAALASSRGQRCSSPGCPCSVPSVFICEAPFLPSSHAPPVSCGMVVVLSPG